MDLKLIRLEGAEPLTERQKKYTLGKGIIKIAKLVSVNNTIEFSTFHTYSERIELSH